MADPSSGAERGARLRALAARALARVHAGASMREILATTRERLPEARDRALLSALLFGALRANFRHRALLRQLLARLPAEGTSERALLHLGLAQLEVLALPAHAAVSATAEAARTLGRPGMVPLVNAVLRRFLREREALLAAVAADPEARLGHPAWLRERLAADWGEEAAARIMAANLEPAALWLHVNRQRVTRERLLAALAERGLAAAADAHLADAVRLPGSADPRALPGYAEGWFSVQDGAGQWAAELLCCFPGARVLDACAAPGGKTAALLGAGKLELTALEREPGRFARLRANLERLGLEARLLQADATRPETFADGRPYDRILVDAPCSATGVIRRQPDVLIHRRPDDLPALTRAQRAMLEALWPLLAPGGRLLYATCSVLRDENDRLVGAFLAGRGDARPLPLTLPVGRPAPPGWQILPGEGGMDGFFVAVLERDPAAGGVHG